MRVLFLIVARGGSKSIPRKNLLSIEGLSLIGYRALSAKQSTFCSRLIISSDCPEIQAEAKRYGVEVPFTRPQQLASDTASTDEVVLHAMEYIEAEARDRFDAVLILEPSSPFGTHYDYDKAIHLLQTHDANLVVGLKEVQVSSVFQSSIGSDGNASQIVARLKNMASVRRQDMAVEYTLNGALYLVRWDFFKKTKYRYADPDRSYGLIMDKLYSTEIDEYLDFDWINFLVRSGKLDLSYWKEQAVKSYA